MGLFSFSKKKKEDLPPLADLPPLSGSSLPPLGQSSSLPSFPPVSAPQPQPAAFPPVGDVAVPAPKSVPSFPPDPFPKQPPVAQMVQEEQSLPVSEQHPAEELTFQLPDFPDNLEIPPKPPEQLQRPVQSTSDDVPEVPPPEPVEQSPDHDDSFLFADDESLPQAALPQTQPLPQSYAYPERQQMPPPVAPVARPVMPVQRPVAPVPVAPVARPVMPVQPPVASSPVAPPLPPPPPPAEVQFADEPLSAEERIAPVQHRVVLKRGHTTDIFVEKAAYRDVLISLTQMEKTVSDASKHLDRIIDDEAIVTAKIGEWHDLLDEVQEKLINIDTKLFEKGDA